MNGVYGKRVVPRDVRLVRGDSERLGGWWRRRDLSTGEITPVDLSAWSGRIELRSPDGTLWYSRACDETQQPQPTVRTVGWGCWVLSD